MGLTKAEMDGIDIGQDDGDGNIEEHDDAGEESIPAPEPQTEMPVAKARFLSK